MRRKLNIPYLFSAVSRRAVAIAALAACLPAGSAVAAPSYYNMPNGGSASYNYWDESYNGSGCVTCNYVPLSGGRGDLTDGFIATSNWNVTEAPPGNGPYVGWLIDPTITFHWNSSISIGSVTFYFDDSGFGGVRPPASVIVNGTTYAVTDPDPASRAPFAFTAGGVSFTGNDLVVTINRDRGGWVFLSEVEFNGVSNVPEPGTLALLGLGLGLAGLAATRRRKQ